MISTQNNLLQKYYYKDFNPKIQRKLLIFISIFILVLVSFLVIIYIYKINTHVKLQKQDNQSMLIQSTAANKFPDNGYGIAAGGGLAEMSQINLDSYFKALSDLGVTWVRWDIDWSRIQPYGPDMYDWEGSDRVANTALKYKINSLGIITYTPKWARSDRCINSDKCSPRDPNEFGKFAGEVAKRYLNKNISHWEIWNEPNLKQFWEPEPDVLSYNKILKSSYLEIKKSNPNAMILSGGLASTPDIYSENVSMLNFITQLYKTSSIKYFDGISIHPYSYPYLPASTKTFNNWQQIYSLKNLMDINGDSNKPIWITEFGAPTNGPGKSFTALDSNGFNRDYDYLSEDSQAIILKEAINILPGLKKWLGPFFWYNLKDNYDSVSSPENAFGLLRFDSSKKPAYYIYQTAINKSK